MSGDPSISVILPTYNRADLVSRAIESVLDQTFEDFELIVVDDGSTDETKQVVDRIDDPRIEYIRHEENQGGAAARNTGIEAATGEYLAFLDDDDEWLPRKLELQQRRMEETDEDVAIVYCQYNKYSDISNRIERDMLGAMIEGEIYDALLAGWSPPTSVILAESRVIKEIDGFDESLPSYQDYDLLLRAAERSQYTYIHESLVIKHLHRGPQNIKNPDARERGFKRICKKWRKEMENHISREEFEKYSRRQISHIYWLYAIKYGKERDLWRSMRHFRRSISAQNKPPSVRRCVGYFLLLFGGVCVFQAIQMLYQQIMWDRPNNRDRVLDRGL